MEQVKRTRRKVMVPCSSSSSEKRHLIPEELIQYIQSLLPVEDAARTTLLSESWLHAWSTIPNLRYFRDNIPIISFDLHLENIHDPESIHKCLTKLASKTCLRELYLKLFVVSSSYTCTLPDEIFSGENLNTISVEGDIGGIRRVKLMPTTELFFVTAGVNKSVIG